MVDLCFRPSTVRLAPSASKDLVLYLPAWVVALDTNLLPDRRVPHDRSAVYLEVSMMRQHIEMACLPHLTIFLGLCWKLLL